MVEKIKGILASTDTSLDRLKGDVLRVLGLGMGRLWLSELRPELETFRTTLGLTEPVDAKELRRVIEELVREGVLEAEERIKATFTGGEKDLLVGVKDVNALLIAVRSDEAYRRYQSLIHRGLRRDTD